MRFLPSGISSIVREFHQNVSGRNVREVHFLDSVATLIGSIAEKQCFQCCQLERAATGQVELGCGLGKAVPGWTISGTRESGKREGIMDPRTCRVGGGIVDMEPSGVACFANRSIVTLFKPMEKDR